MTTETTALTLPERDEADMRIRDAASALLAALRPFAAGYDSPAFRNAAVEAVALADGEMNEDTGIAA